jgi:hypothetical protein
MSEPTLGDALVRKESAAIEAHQQAGMAMQRERSRVRRWSILAVLMWLLAAAGILLFHFGFLILFLPKINFLLTKATEAQRQKEWPEVVYYYGTLTPPVVVISVIALLLAALSTLRLVFASRQATLRQINLSLAQISEQIKMMNASR